MIFWKLSKLTAIEKFMGAPIITIQSGSHDRHPPPVTMLVQLHPGLTVNPLIPHLLRDWLADRGTWTAGKPLGWIWWTSIERTLAPVNQRYRARVFWKKFKVHTQVLPQILWDRTPNCPNSVWAIASQNPDWNSHWANTVCLIHTPVQPQRVGVMRRSLYVPWCYDRWRNPHAG